MLDRKSESDSSFTLMGLLDSLLSSPKVLGAFDFKLIVDCLAKVIADFLAIVCVLPNFMLGSIVSYVCESF